MITSDPPGFQFRAHELSRTRDTRLHCADAAPESAGDRLVRPFLDFEKHEWGAELERELLERCGDLALNLLGDQRSIRCRRARRLLRHEQRQNPSPSLFAANLRNEQVRRDAKEIRRQAPLVIAALRAAFVKPDKCVLRDLLGPFARVREMRQVVDQRVLVTLHQSGEGVIVALARPLNQRRVALRLHLR